jgi:FKBP-type peptidyl-prolyl cis-trans isomerase
MNRTLLAIALTTLAAVPATAQETTPPPAPNPANADYHFQYLNRLDPAQGWRRTPSGLRYRRVSGTGRGAHPTVADNVTIHYVGRFIDGTEFDSSVARGAPATFPLGRLIRGWQEGVPIMGVGDRYEFAIPYTLAYGYAGRGPIPGGATLLFTIDLIAIAPAAAQ